MCPNVLSALRRSSNRSEKAFTAFHSASKGYARVQSKPRRSRPLISIGKFVIYFGHHSFVPLAQRSGGSSICLADNVRMPKEEAIVLFSGYWKSVLAVYRTPHADGHYATRQRRKMFSSIWWWRWWCAPVFNPHKESNRGSPTTVSGVLIGSEMCATRDFCANRFAWSVKGGRRKLL